MTAGIELAPDHARGTTVGYEVSQSIAAYPWTLNVMELGNWLIRFSLTKLTLAAALFLSSRGRDFRVGRRTARQHDFAARDVDVGSQDDQRAEDRPPGECFIEQEVCGHCHYR